MGARLYQIRSKIFNIPNIAFIDWRTTLATTYRRVATEQWVIAIEAHPIKPCHPVGEVIESDQIAAGLGSPSFEYRYQVTVGLLDFAGHTDQVMVPVLQWLRQHQPSLLQNTDTAREAIQFEAEILNHSSYDLKLQI
ncbi:phage tail protein [Chitinivorax sp. B]|uniref:phage tail protein n=1 Tax=Chitinivorax sp. B TaxID=2502235 RepID=UPI00148563B6|nr:phage tail protein [Chitinivorax sp. B]